MKALRIVAAAALLIGAGAHAHPGADAATC